MAIVAEASAVYDLSAISKTLRRPRHPDVSVLAGQLFPQPIFIEAHETFDIIRSQEAAGFSLFTSDAFQSRVVLQQAFENYSTDLLTDLCKTSWEIDDRINFDLQSRLPNTSEHSWYRRVFRTKFKPETVVKQQTEYLRTLTQSMEAYSNLGKKVTAAAPMRGALPIMRQLETLGFSAKPLPISGSIGTETGHATIGSAIDPELLDPDAIIVYTEDVNDSSKTFTEFLIARYLVMHGWNLSMAGVVDYSEFQRIHSGILSLPEEVEALHDQKIKPIDKRARTVWAKVAELADTVDVKAAFLYDKNRGLVSALQKRVIRKLGKDSNNIEPQTDLNLLGRTVKIGKKEWIIGGAGNWQPMMDTFIEGQDIARAIAERHPYKEKEIDAYLRSIGLHYLGIRVFPGLRGLYVFDGNALGLFIEYIGDRIMEGNTGKYISERILTS